MAVRKNRHDPFRSSIIGEPLCRSRRPTKTAYQQFRGIGSPTFSLAFTHRRSDGRQGRRDEHRDAGAQAQSGTTASLRRWRYDAAASTQRQRDVGTGRRSVYAASSVTRGNTERARTKKHPKRTVSRHKGPPPHRSFARVARQSGKNLSISI